MVSFVCKQLDDTKLIDYSPSVFEAANNGITLSDWMQQNLEKTVVTSYMYYTVPTIFFAVLQCPTEPIRGLKLLIRAGGDVDTICAIAGEVWGVKCGENIAESVKEKRLEPNITTAFLQKLSEQAQTTCKTHNVQLGLVAW